MVKTVGDGKAVNIGCGRGLFAVNGVHHIGAQCHGETICCFVGVVTEATRARAHQSGKACAVSYAARH